MHGIRFSIFAALAAFILGLGLGHYAFRSPESVRVENSQPRPGAIEAASFTRDQPNSGRYRDGVAVRHSSGATAADREQLSLIRGGGAEP